MREAAEWIAAHADGARPVLVAYPLSFDWSFLHWYFIRFTGESPFGHSSCLDIRTLYLARALTTFDRSSQPSMPPVAAAARGHTRTTRRTTHRSRRSCSTTSSPGRWAAGVGPKTVSPTSSGV